MVFFKFIIGAISIESRLFNYGEIDMSRLYHLNGGSLMGETPEWVEVTNENLARYQWAANPAGVILFKKDPENPQTWTRYCSGFLFGKEGCDSSQTFVTAGHCDPLKRCRRLADEYGVDRFAVEFDYHIGGQPKRYAVKDITSACHCEGTNESIDCASLKLSSSSASKRYGFFHAQRPCDGQKVVLAHHPEGTTKKISAGHIVDLDKKNGIFTHNADTQKGSSGCCVLSANSRKVIGVHVQGKSKERDYNLAVSIANCGLGVK